ncbi:MAG: hypothetical protein KDC76_10625 [Bacteroidetes bacterium]|nr:hypothetical protein [Bacteroidota bacterium]
MNWSKEHDRKGLVGTVFIHLIIFLLMFIWLIGEAHNMQEEESGIEVSFGDPLSGGPDDLSQVADAQESPADNQENTTAPQVSETTPTPSNNTPVVTNQQSDAPEVNTQSKPTVTQPKEEDRGRVDSHVTDYLKNRNKTKNSDQNTEAGPGQKPGPGGNSTTNQPGPGGQNNGDNGSGVSWSLEGFVVSGVPNIQNRSQDFGTVVVKICLDQNGAIKYLNVEGGNTSSTYLKELTMESVRKFGFKALGSQTSYNCGTISITYQAK